MYKLIIAFFLFPIIVLSQNQEVIVSGVIKDFDTKQPIPYCLVQQENSTNNTISDDKGNFSLVINVLSAKTRLFFQASNYEIDTVEIAKQTNFYNVFLKSQSVYLDEVVVTGGTRSTLIKENPLSITLISTKQIERTTESTIIDVLAKNTPGLNVLKTGPNISKPFIHGLGYNRVLTLYDGIRQEGQQYGDEHGIEVDDYNLDHAEVIKGPASLLYGSDAIAGVVSLFPFVPKAQDGKIHGKWTSEYQTNNNLIGNALRLSYGKKGFVASVSGSYRLAKNYRNSIDGRVYLTNFDVKNLSTLLGYNYRRGYVHVYATLFDNRQGIPDGSRDSLSRKFTYQIFDENDDLYNRPIVSEKNLNTYKIPSLTQHIQHYRVYVYSFHEVGKGALDVLVGGQRNIRREYTHPSAVKQAGMYMQLNTLNYSFRYNFPQYARFETSVGINGMLQNNTNKDATDFPIPDYNLYDGGMYLYTKWNKKKWNISGGVRYDLRFVQWKDFFVGTNPLTGFEQQSHSNDAEANLQFEAFQKLFQGLSGSVGVTFNATNYFGIKANIGRAYRAPSITELGSNGLDPGAHIVYLGNKTFNPEFSLQEDIGVYLNLPSISGEISLFNNAIQNYIYMSTLADEAGNPVVDAQGNRTYQYQQAKAHLYGGEFWIAYHPKKLNGFRWQSSGSLVYGFNRNTAYRGKKTAGEYLPLIPPFTVQSNVSYEIRLPSKIFKVLTPKIEVEYVAQQNRYLGLNGTETATLDYALLHIGLSTNIAYSQNHSLQIVFQVNNLLDRAYQSHLNRLKYFEHYSQTPNQRSGIYNMGRNFVLKVLIPF